MKLGVGIPAKSTDEYCIPQQRLVDYVQRAEEYGFASAWIPEHLTRPPSFTTSFHDPLTTLGTIAGATERIDLGTSILILPLRNPVLVAKRAKTIQYFSENRLTLGVGQGYLENEYEAVGVPYEQRHDRFSEGIELLFRLLGEENVTFDGEFYQTDDLTIEPTLRQPPQILSAGGGVERDGEWKVANSVVRRIDTVGGWIASSQSPIGNDWDAISAKLASADTDPTSVEKVGLQHIHLEPGEDPALVREKQHSVFDDFIGDQRGLEHVDDNFLVGTVDDVLDRLEEYRSTGFDEVILLPAAHTGQEIDRQLELWHDYLLPEFR